MFPVANDLLFSLIRVRPSISTLFIADEARQYLNQGVKAISNSPTLLRDAKIKLFLMFQSWPAVINSLGQSGADELLATAVCQVAAINDMETARMTSERLGKFTVKRKGRSPEIIDLVTPAEVLKQLSIRSNLSYVMGGGYPNMRIERLAFKTMTTSEGTFFRGLPLHRQMDEHLSRYRYGSGNRKTF